MAQRGRGRKSLNAEGFNQWVSVQGGLYGSVTNLTQWGTNSLVFDGQPLEGEVVDFAGGTYTNGLLSIPVGRRPAEHDALVANSATGLVELSGGGLTGSGILVPEGSAFTRDLRLCHQYDKRSRRGPCDRGAAWPGALNRACVQARAVLIPMSFQDETKARWILDRWRGASEAHIRSDLQRASNEARGPKDKRISLILKAHWN